MSSQKAHALQRTLLKGLIPKRNHVAVASSQAVNPAPAVNFHTKDISYSSLLEGLQKPQQSTSNFGKPHLKPFNEIHAPKNQQELKERASLRIPWSSSYDSVTRSPFAKDLIHLQSLLDALLASENFQRAENILDAMMPLVSSTTFLNSVNQYLEGLAQSEDSSVSDIIAFLDKMPLKYRVSPNGRSVAIAISKAMSEGQDYMTFVHKFNDPRTLRSTFENIDILTLEQLSVIFTNPAIQEHHVPTDLRNLYHEVRKGVEGLEDPKETPFYFADRTKTAPIIEADTEEIKAVDSFGLTVIRHTLLGLETETPLNLDEIFKTMNEDMSHHVLHNRRGKRQNYHEIYKSLKTDEDRKKFNDALDVFNLMRQRELESKGLDAAREKWKHEFEEMKGRGDLSISKSLNAQLYQWYLDLLPYIEKEMDLCRKLLKDDLSSESISAETKLQMKERAFYAPYFVLVSSKQLAVITLLELLKLNSTGGIADGMRTARAVISVGKAVELEYKSKLLSSNDKKIMKMKDSSLWKKFLQNRKAPEATDNQLAQTEWEIPVCAKLGAILTSFLLHVAKVTVHGTDPTTGKKVTGKQPAFHHTYQFSNGQRLGVIRLHKKLITHLAGKSMVNSVQPQLLPMLVAPRPWNLRTGGGYRFTHSSLVRIKDSAETVAYVKAAGDAGDLDNVYKGLNVLGDTPWTINSKILSIITHYWNRGNKFLDLPPVFEDPVLPELLPFDAEPQEKAEYYQKVRQILQDAASFRSQRCDSNYKLEIARAFVGEKIFFPHNIDFRGRAYPLSPHFNHLGNDMTRSLFLFWDGKELGSEGLKWLKIHLANLYGLDKVPLIEREAFVDNNLDQIIRAAEDPYAEEKWWSKAEKPWQVLSVCFELREAYKLEDPTKFFSHIPVHQDGTCNGLQHYAALGGDIEGARQVNLLPAERPLDVYKFVAGLVEKRLNAEAEAGNELAKFMKGRITRKVVKQTVMTNVYGVTFVGAVAQIEKQMDDWFEKDELKLLHDHSRYLTLLVFDSMRELFEGAHLIQDWLGEAAKRISKSIRTDQDFQNVDSGKPDHSSSVVWTTPLGLPCVQPYRMTNKQVVTTYLQDISITDPFEASQVDARKQATAFPPNFIHSLDATHMLLTSAACGDKGLSFASVHDSYWTHALDVNDMNSIIRQQFVNLHKEDLVVRLREEFERRYKGFLRTVYIDGTHELAAKIRAIRRKIARELGKGLTLADEIQLENKRQQLLKSPSAQDNQLGREMETTISVTEGYDIDSIVVQSSKSKSMQILTHLEFPQIPKRGDLDVEIVKSAPYFFS